MGEGGGVRGGGWARLEAGMGINGRGRGYSILNY